MTAAAPTRPASQQPPISIGAGRRVITAGSTHRGEEAILLEVLARLRKKYPDLVLIIAPRHPERFDEVSGLITNAGFECQRRTRLKIWPANHFSGTGVGFLRYGMPIFRRRRTFDLPFQS